PGAPGRAGLRARRRRADRTARQRLPRARADPGRGRRSATGPRAARRAGAVAVARRVGGRPGRAVPVARRVGHRVGRVGQVVPQVGGRPGRAVVARARARRPAVLLAGRFVAGPRAVVLGRGRPLDGAGGDGARGVAGGRSGGRRRLRAPVTSRRATRAGRAAGGAGGPVGGALVGPRAGTGRTGRCVVRGGVGLGRGVAVAVRRLGARLHGGAAVRVGGT